MVKISGKLVQLFCFVPGAAIAAALAPPDIPRAARFQQEARRRAPIVFLYSVSLYALVFWGFLVIHAMPSLPPAQLPRPPSPVPAIEPAPASSPRETPPTSLAATAQLTAPAPPIVSVPPASTLPAKMSPLTSSSTTVTQPAKDNTGTLHQGPDHGAIGTGQHPAHPSGISPVPLAPAMHPVPLNPLSSIRSAMLARADSAEPGSPISWDDPSTNSHGVITFEKRQANKQGAVCRRYTYTIESVAFGRSAALIGATCRNAGGVWQHVAGPLAQSAQQSLTR